MYVFDIGQHNLPHVHARHGDFEAVVEIPTGRLLDGDLPSKKLRKVQAWIELNQDEIMQEWAKAAKGTAPNKID